MTRFARAKGSKSSNLKAPEDSTPWEVMKEQMLKAKTEQEDSKKRKEAEQQRIENYENFLKERKVEKRKAEWCDFPESQTSKVENRSESSQTKKAKGNRNIETNAISEYSQCSTDAKKKKKKKIKNDSSKNMPQELLQSSPNNCLENVSNVIEQPKEKPIKENKKRQQVNDPNIKETTKKMKKSSKMNKVDNAEAIQNQPANLEVNNLTKQKKKHGDKPIRRKEINDKSFQLIINGKDVELVRFDGFPIMKKDAERIQELKNSMIKKGIPKSEVQRTIKLERRRAEKALARLKRDVCYNCRKGGHNLSDCPDLRSNIPGVDSADGVCFKCGSTEHRQNECKVQRDKEFRFATCFICRETGHLARQCPDNPKGLYPNGGCCKLCGDVTHLRKDCPTVAEKKEGTSIKLSTLDGYENTEDIGKPDIGSVQQEPSKKPKKIKF
ncbi:unnamed protein product [Leptosia nina]|uniref:CCHC-type domain-containing protein n=1 Tax=Leptosia nina TaxID=320188 RepID=A0AAV1K4D7_9NEOP